MKTTIEDILLRIEQADDLEISQIMDAVRKRFAVKFPDWEIFFISCPKNDPAQRQQTLEYISNHFQSI